jgi:hypothetical protein
MQKGRSIMHLHRTLIALPVLLILSDISMVAGAQSSPPAPQPATTSRPATNTSGDAHVDAILDRLEIKGGAIKGLKCEVIYKYITPVPITNEQVKEGNLLFSRSAPNSKFLIHFKTLIVDDVKRETGEYFLFDGQWLTERNDKSREIRKQQIARPGQETDPFKLGKGPFPLPFGQKRSDILENFKVTLEKFTLGDPRGSEHLHCVPLGNTELSRRYSRVEIFVDKSLELPVRIVSENIKDDSRIEVDFKNIDINDAPAASRFVIDQPKGYAVTEDPLDDGAAPSVHQETGK